MDLRRPKLECVLAEAFTVIAEADEAVKNLHAWMKPESVSRELSHGDLFVVGLAGATVPRGHWRLTPFYPIHTCCRR